MRIFVDLYFVFFQPSYNVKIYISKLRCSGLQLHNAFDQPLFALAKQVHWKWRRQRVCDVWRPLCIDGSTEDIRWLAAGKRVDVCTSICTGRDY